MPCLTRFSYSEMSNVFCEAEVGKGTAEVGAWSAGRVDSGWRLGQAVATAGDMRSPDLCNTQTNTTIIQIIKLSQLFPVFFITLF